MIIGIDPSTVSSGIALIDDSVYPAIYKHSKVIKTSWRKKNQYKVYYEQVFEVVEKFLEIKNLKIYMEQPFLNPSKKKKNPKAFASHVEIMSLWKLALEMNGLKYTMVAPVTWQNAIGIRYRGTGLSTKEQCKNIVVRYYDLDFNLRKDWPTDQFDALGIAHYGFMIKPSTHKKLYELLGAGKKKK
jgi:Holliday junction resolvasome RuvABC endonuclease subunit